MIHKAAGIIIQDRRLLVARSRVGQAFISPGGRVHADETPQQALIRELQEELGITVAESDLEPFGTFHANAANHPDQQIKMDVFIVRRYEGIITPDNEIEELRWITSEYGTGIIVGSIFAHDVLPKLKGQGLVD